MATKADPITKKEFKVVPSGTHLARCYSFIHIGHVPNTFQGATTPTVNKIRLTWELPEELTTFKEGEAAQPFSIAQEYTLSMNEKANLRKLVQGWTGKPMNDQEASDFDAETLVGMECLLTVSHKEGKDGRTYAQVQNITKLPSKMACPPQVNESKIITWDGMTAESFAALPEFIQNKMKESSEYKKFAGIEESPF